MNEIEYILRILLKARDETAAAFRSAREQLRLFVNAADDGSKKLDKFNASMATMEKNMDGVTRKIREWRAVIQGLGDDNDESAKSIAKVGKETDTYVKTTQRAIRSQKDLSQQSSRLNQDLNKLHKEVKEGNLTNDQAVAGYKRLGRELDTVSNKLTVNTREWRRALDRARDAKASAQAIIDAEKRAVAAVEQAEKRKVQVAKDAAKEREDLAKRVTKQREDAEKAAIAAAQREADAERRIRDKSIADQQAASRRQLAANERARAQALAAELRDRERTAQQEARIAQQQADRQEAIRVAETRRRRVLDSRGVARLPGGNVSELRILAREYEKLSRSAREGSDEQSHFGREAENVRGVLRRLQRDANNTSSTFQRLKGIWKDNEENIATLDNKLRGVGLLLVIGFAQQLITVLEGLAGSLVAVASSAVEAAAALGGIFVAGVMQAIPVVALLGAAFAQVKSVIDAVKQAQLQRQQASVQGQAADRRNADAADAVANAQEGLANAQRQLSESQQGLTKAREDARRELQDLIAAENEAKLAAIGAALSQKEAQQALIQAQARGDVAGIQRAQLQVLQAQADAQDKLTQKKRATADADRAVRGGVEGMPAVVQARRAVEDAERAVDKANRGIETARRNAAEAAAGTESAAQKLNFLLAQMTEGQRKLFHALEDLRKTYLRVFGPITDIILASFTRLVRRLNVILGSPEFLTAARRLATGISTQLNRIIDAFTGDKMIAQFLRIANEARKNLAPVTTIFINLGQAFANIGEDAGPAFRKLIDFVGDLVGKFENLTENRKGLTDFFLEGEKHFEAWITLGLSVIRLFLALSGAGGAASGLRTVQDATKAVDDLTQKVNDNADAVAKFFEDSRGILNEVVGVLVSVVTEMGKAWTPERIENFADFLKRVLIPAIGDTVKVLGGVTAFITAIADTPVGGDILKAAVAFILLNRALSGFAGLAKLGEGVLGAMSKTILTLTRGIPAVAAALEAMEGAGIAAFLPWIGWALVIVAVVAGIVLLLKHLGLLDDAWAVVTDAAGAFWDEVGPSFDKVLDAVGELVDAFKLWYGIIAGGNGILRPFLSILIQLARVILPILTRILGRELGGILDVLAGAFKLIADILRGRFGDALKDVGQIARGFVRAITAPFTVIAQVVGRLLARLVRSIAGHLSDIASSFGHWAKRAVVNFMHFLRGLVGDIGDFFEKLPGRIRDFGTSVVHALGNIGKSAAKAFVDAFKNVGSDIISGILRGLKGAGGFAKDIANAFIDLLNALLPNKIAVPGAPDINLPDNPIHHLAAGGPVAGYGGGDRVRALLEGGEHVLTKEEVAAAGGHLAIFALRRALGGGGQSGGSGFQAGGAVAGSGALAISFHGGDLDNFQSQWRQFWNVLVSSARRGANAVEEQFRDMRVNTARNADLMYRRIRGSIADIQHSFDARGNRITSNWADTWDKLTQTAYDGLFYIAHETNRALHGLEEKTVNFGLTPPKKAEGKQRGGMIPGYGDGDRVHVLAEPGEGFINKRAVRALGGPAAIDAINKMIPRFQGGGMVPIPGQPGETINPSILGDVVKLIRQYKLRVYDGFGGSPPHAPNSDHKWGGAIDVGPGPGGSWALVTRLANWAEPSQNQPRKPFRWVGYNGDPGHGEGNHLHLSWIKGAHLTGVFGGAFKEIARRLVSGPDGALKDIVQAGLDKTLKIANDYVKKAYNATFETGEPGAEAKVGDVGPGAAGIFRFFKQQGFTDEQAAGWIGNLTVESGLNPAIIQPNGQGHGLVQWGGGRFAALQAFAKAHGKPWQDMGTQLAFIMQELHGPESGAYGAIKGAKSVDEAVDAIGTKYERYGVRGERNAPAHAAFEKFAGKFEQGGIVPGPAGKPVPILAHAREWILNQGQVGRIARMLGTSTDALRSMMGFYGGPSGAQGGTEVTAEEIKPQTTRDVQRIGDRLLTRIVFSLRAIGRHIDLMTVRAVSSTGAWQEAASQTFDRLDRVAVRMRQVSAKVRGRAVFGFIEALERLTAEGGVLDNIRSSIELATTRAGRRRITARFAVGGTRGAANVLEVRSAARQAQQELTDLQAERTPLTEERADIRGAIRRTLDQLKQKQGTDARNRLRAQLNNLRTRFEDADQRVADNTQAIFEAQVNAQQALADAIGTQYDRLSSQLDRTRRYADALGNTEWLDSIDQQQRDLLQQQADALQARIAPARAAGAIELANQLADQVADLQVQIFESIQQSVQNAADRINAVTQRRLGRADLAGRLLDATGVVGQFAGGAVGITRQGVFAERGAALQAQRAGLQGVLGQAAALGNRKLIEDLEDQIAELNVTIQENTRAAFSARLDAVNNAAQYSLGINDLNKQIADLTETMAGQLDQQRILAGLQERANILLTQRAGLEALLAEAQAAQDQQAIQDLTQQLLENQLATLQNTQAVNEATGMAKNPQTFTSSAWTWFREAIFNGMGQVLPQYNMAQNLMGGINSGAVIAPATAMSSRVSGDTNINLYEAGRPVDLQEVSAAVAFASKTAQ